MANYPQLDNTRGVWNMKQVYDAAMTGLWPNASGGRAIYVGGATPGASNVIDFITMSSAGNATDFGDLRGNKNTMPGVCSSFTRGLIGDATNIDYIEYASTGNAADFGDLSSARSYLGGLNSSTRGVFAGGNGFSNVIDYVTIASHGDAADFGNLTSGRQEPGNASSPTRGLTCAGQNSPSGPYYSNIIDYVEIASAGDATDFGDATRSGTQMSGCSSSTRGVFMGGQQQPASPAYFDIIDYVTIASTGNAADFGDLSAAKTSSAAASNSVRGIIAGGEVVGDSTPINIIEQFTIASTGDATDFGDLATARKNIGAGSNQNGGLNDGFTRIFPIASGLGVGQRGLFNKGKAGGQVDYHVVSTTGNATAFGDLGHNRSSGGSMGASSTRAVESIGDPGSPFSNEIRYKGFATLGVFADFGDQTRANAHRSGFSNNLRAASCGGEPNTNTIDYVTIATLGNALDFGDATSIINAGTHGVAGSSTRGVYQTGTAPNTSALDYVTIASTGNALDFGDSTIARSFGGCCSSAVRGVFASGAYNPGSNVIDYVTIASTGNATDFGDLSSARYDCVGLSNNVRGVFNGGFNSSTIIDYITIGSTGDASDFGDPTSASSGGSGNCNGYGGLPS